MTVGKRRWTAAGSVAVGVVLALAATCTPAPAAAPGGTVRHPGRPLPLDHLFDNTAVGVDARPGTADFDGAGTSLSARDLDAAGWTPGRRLLLAAAPLTWPRTAAGHADNVVSDGQRVLVRGRGGALSFLVAATSPTGPGTEATGTGTVHYADGSTGRFTLTAPDWRGGSPATAALSLPHVVSAGGPREERARLFAVSVPVAPGRPIAAVTLPADPGPAADLHVFAVAVRPGEGGAWTGSWAAGTGGYTAVGPWTDRTLRLVVHTSAGGPRVRVRLDNTFAPAPVDIGHASVAVRDTGAGSAAAPLPLTFRGRSSARIPAGSQLFSDPLRFTVPPSADLLVSIHLPGTVTAAPVHSQALQTSYLSADGGGDLTGTADGSAFSATLTAWPFLTGVDVGGGSGSVVALGDSITDGVRSTAGANHRWPDVLAQRLAAEPPGSGLPRWGVLNQGISANRVVTDRYPGEGVDDDTAGVSAQHRLERDVFAQTGARTLVVFEGINDVRWGTSAAEVVDGLRAVAQRARARGLRVVAATITPCEGYTDCTAEVDARRTAVNAFLRTAATGTDAVLDALLDFDAVVRDPGRPARMRADYDSGDHLHPGDAGLRALAESIDLAGLVP